MGVMSAESEAAHDRGTQSIIRTITLAGLITIAATIYDFVSNKALGNPSPIHPLYVASFVGVLLVVMVAAWLGFVASSRAMVGLIFGLLGLYLLTATGNLIFFLDAPDRVARYMPWTIAALIIPFLTTNRSFARALCGTYVAAMLLVVGAHVLRLGVNPFTVPCCADLILFCLVLIVAYLLLDGFARFREAAIKFHARSDALREHAAEMECALAAADEARALSDAAHREAEKSIKLRETFLATMSHELRTPLNAIIGFSEVMKSDALGEGEEGADLYRTYAADIHQSGEHVLGLINQLLEYSRIRSGTFELKPADLHLEEMMRFIHRMSQSSAEAKGVTLDIEMGIDRDTIVRADRHALIQIGLNLIGNALKFTEPGGKVTLKASLDDEGHVSLQVTDTGAGIPADKLKEVCQPFVRLGDASLASETGTGLGLAIITALADAMDTPFVLESEEGKGTTASLILPISLNTPKSLTGAGLAAE